jgi:hypothetical protein
MTTLSSVGNIGTNNQQSTINNQQSADFKSRLEFQQKPTQVAFAPAVIAGGVAIEEIAKWLAAAGIIAYLGANADQIKKSIADGLASGSETLKGALETLKSLPAVPSKIKKYAAELLQSMNTTQKRVTPASGYYTNGGILKTETGDNQPKTPGNSTEETTKKRGRPPKKPKDEKKVSKPDENNTNSTSTTSKNNSSPPTTRDVTRQQATDWALDKGIRARDVKNLPQDAKLLEKGQTPESGTFTKNSNGDTHFNIKTPQGGWRQINANDLVAPKTPLKAGGDSINEPRSSYSLDGIVDSIYSRGSSQGGRVMPRNPKTYY